MDFVFASNLFEHLKQEEFAAVLRQVRSKLRQSGTLNILQPNYRFAYREYFDDYTHVAVYSDRSLSGFLTAQSFGIIECRPRFLPLTVKSTLTVADSDSTLSFTFLQANGQTDANPGSKGILIPVRDNLCGKKEDNAPSQLQVVFIHRKNGILKVKII